MNICQYEREREYKPERHVRRRTGIKINKGKINENENERRNKIENKSMKENKNQNKNKNKEWCDFL